MRKFASILGLILLAAALVGAGWWLGFQNRYLTEAYAVTTLDKHLTDMAVKSVILEQIDSGRIDEAREFLRLRLDSDIIVVDSMSDSSDARSRDLTAKVFARIAAHRAAYGSNYAIRVPAIDTKVAEILGRGAEKQK
jgi:hypothetical protein